MSRIHRLILPAVFACLFALPSAASVVLTYGGYTGSMKAGEPVDIYLYFYNDGATDAHDLALTITGESGLRFASLVHASPIASCSSTDAVLTCTAAMLASHGSFVVEATFSSDASLPPDYATALALRMTVGGVSVYSGTVHPHVAGAIDARIEILSPPPLVAGLGATMEATMTNSGPYTLYDPVVTVAGAFVDAIQLIPSDSRDCENTGDASFRCFFPTSLAPGVSSKISFNIYPKSSEKGPGTITATLQPRNDDTAPANNTFVLNVPVSSMADVQTSIQGNTGPFFIGSLAGNVPIHISSQSLGPSDTGRGTLTYDIPPSYAFQSLKSALGSPSCTTPAAGQSGRVTCTDTTARFDVTVTVRAVTSGTTTHTATVQAETQDPVPSNNSASINIWAVDSPDIAVSVSASPAHPKPGELLTFTAVVKNEGLGHADTVIVDHEYSAGLQNTDGSNHRYLYQYVSLDPGQSMVLQGTVTVTATTGTVSDDVLVYTAGEVNTANNKARAEVEIAGPQADLAVTLHADRTTVSPGERMSCTAVITNSGPDRATDVVLTNVLPAGASLETAAIAGGTCTTTSGIVCRVAALEPGVSVSATFTFYASGTTGAGYDDASVTSATSDKNTVNNTVRMPVTVFKPNEDFADLAVSMTASAPSIVIGTPVTFEIVVRNIGSAAATNVHLTDSLPAGLVPVSVPANCTMTGQKVDCGIATLDSGSSKTLRIDATMHGSGATTNSVAAATSTLELNMTNNSAAVRVSGVLARGRGARH